MSEKRRKVYKMTIAVQSVVLPRQIANSAHIYRQVFATFAASLLSLTGGMTFGFTAVLLPQLECDKTFPYDKNFDSWIASISPLAMTMGCLFSGTMSDGIGRKKGQIVLILPFTIGWIVMGLATNNTMMLIGRFITGISTGAVRANSMVYIAELTDPKYRAIALFCPSLAILTGSFISHTVGKYVYWKTSCYIFALPNSITLFTLLFLKESPLWLLTKGKIDEGIESFRLFRGTGENAEKELKAVLDRCKANAEESTLKDKLIIVVSRPFLKSIATIFILFFAVQWSGVNTLSFYAEDIYHRTFSGDVDAYFFMLGADCIRITTATTVCLCAMKLPRKITFVSCCFTVTILLATLVTYLSLNPAGLVWLAVLCMITYIALASAITCISWSFVAEIFPAKVRGFGSGLSSGISFALLFSSVKITPEIIAHFGEKVLFGTYGCVTLIGGAVLLFILPDTNGKSLQVIEDNLYKNNNQTKTNVDVVSVPSEQPVRIVVNL